MQQGLLDLHNLLRWVILILLIVNIIKNYADIKKPFSKTHKKLGLWLMICAHTTLLVGLALLGFLFTHLQAGANIMKDAVLRSKFVEHPVAMIVAIVLITMGRGVVKKNISDIRKHKRSAGFYLLALIIILAMIPWGSSPLVPGM